MPDTLKPCPCEACLVRKYMANNFDVHVWGEDCPYVCKQYDKWKAGNGMSELKPCQFCSKWDWSEAAAVIDNGKYAHIHLAGGSYRFPVYEQFNYCPWCGNPNPNKNRRVGEGEKG